ncbi:MAG: TolC family protein [Bacteroidia bacterium]|nr:TolC family protein [Bacteroidia bacterium]
MKIYLTFLLGLFLSTASINAQEVWDLEKCIMYARENSLVVQQNQLNIDNVELNLKQNKHSRYPNLNLSSNMGWNFGKTIDPTTNEFITTTFLANGIGLNTGMLLYGGGQLNNSIKAVEANLESVKLDKQQSMNDVALDVASAFLNVLFSEENLENARFRMELSQKQLEQVDKLINAGARPRNERLDLIAQLSTNEQEFVTAENNLTLAFLSLKQLMNLEPDYPLLIERPSDKILLETDPDLISFSEVYGEALTHHPLVESSNQRLLGMEYRVKAVKANLLPRLTMGANLSTNWTNQGLRVDGFETQVFEQDVIIPELQPIIGTDRISIGQEADVPITSKNPYFNQLDENLGYGFGFTFGVPLYNNFTNRADIQRAKIDVLRTQNDNEQLLQILKTNVQQSLTNARSAKKQLEASNRALEAQDAAFNNAEKRFDLGAISIYDYINSKNNLDNARINQIIAKYDYLFKMKVVDYYRGRPLKLN